MPSLDSLPDELRLLIVQHAKGDDHVGRHYCSRNPVISALYRTSQSWRRLCRDAVWEHVKVDTDSKAAVRCLAAGVELNGKRIRQLDIHLEVSRQTALYPQLAMSMAAMRNLESINILAESAADFAIGPLLSPVAHSRLLTNLELVIKAGGDYDLALVANLIKTLPNVESIELDYWPQDGNNGRDAQACIDAMMSRPRLHTLALIGEYGCAALAKSRKPTAPIRCLLVSSDHTDEDFYFEALERFLPRIASILEQLVVVSDESFPSTTRPFQLPHLRQLTIATESHTDVELFAACPLEKVALAVRYGSGDYSWPIQQLERVYIAHSPPVLQEVSFERDDDVRAWCDSRRIRFEVQDESLRYTHLGF
ncbi:hypothetical protein JCM10908_002419 [Rhodotorula pacifica]|uniref:uncharacterized protein n=1 Tax=Rhodotorula pacifica TaxID=1495444 RepID=UPI00316B300D